MGPIGCPEMSLRNYNYSLRNNPEERRSQLLRGGSLKSRRDWLNELCNSELVVLDNFTICTETSDKT